MDGDGDGNEERPSSNRPLPKRLRISEPIVYTHRRAGTASVLASASNSGSRPAAAETIRPEETVAAQEESEDQSSEESDTSWDHTSSESDEASDEEQENQRSGNEEIPVSERLKALDGHGAPRESEGLSGAVSVTLTDPDVLDCPICYEPLCSPVYQVLQFPVGSLFLVNLQRNCQLG